MKKIISILLCAVLLLQLCGCASKKDKTPTEEKADKETESVTGATVFKALKNQVDFDSELTSVEDPETLFQDLPDGSEVTLLKGPDTYSDQLGLVEVEEEEDLPQANESVNAYLQGMYDSACKTNPDQAPKFENVAIWKYDVYVVFCITINYTEATQIIDDTVSGKQETPAPDNAGNDNQPVEQEKPLPDNTQNNDAWIFLGGLLRLEIQGNQLHITNSVYGESLTINCEKYDEGGYTYYYREGDEDMDMVAFVVINDEMIGQLEPYRLDEDSYKVLGYDRYDAPLKTSFGAEFSSYIKLWAFRENSEGTLPSNVDKEELWDHIAGELNPEVLEMGLNLYYYPQSRMAVLGFTDNGVGVGGVGFYIYPDGTYTYVEGISLVHQVFYKDAISTGANYVIVDTK